MTSRTITTTSLATLLLAFLLLLQWHCCHGFQIVKIPATTGTAVPIRRAINTILHYKDDGRDNDSDELQQHWQQQQQKGESNSQQENNIIRSKPIIPVSGPLMNNVKSEETSSSETSSLLLGQEIVLKSLTPMQWNTLQESLAMFMNQQSAIQQSPIIAIIDDYTSTKTKASMNHKKQLPSSTVGRYATIFAIVGMTTPRKASTEADSTPTEAATPSIVNEGEVHGDMASFVKKYYTSSSEKFSLDTTSVRLVAIGRASLDSFFYQIPSSKLQEMTDPDGHIILSSSDKNEIDEDDSDDNGVDDDIHDDIVEPKMNIIMSEFHLLYDTLMNLNGILASPIHSIAEMSTLTVNLNALHQERQSLVAGIKAGRARIQSAQKKQQEESNNNISSQQQQPAATDEEVDDEELFDYDGIGALYFPNDASILVPKMNTIIDDDVAAGSIQTIVKRDLIIDHDDDNDNDDSDKSVETVETTESKTYVPTELATMYSNYGLGTSSASVSSIVDICNVKLEQLKAYYSPHRTGSEEYYYEIYSYAAMETIYDWVTPNDIAWSVSTCYNTVERLQRIYEWMYSHINALKYEAYLVSEELIDCGEECTDLW